MTVLLLTSLSNPNWWSCLDHQSPVSFIDLHETNELASLDMRKEENKGVQQAQMNVEDNTSQPRRSSRLL